MLASFSDSSRASSLLQTQTQTQTQTQPQPQPRSMKIHPRDFHFGLSSMPDRDNTYRCAKITFTKIVNLPR